MLGENPDGTFRIENMEVAKPQKKRISYSQLELLSKCGVAYERRYIRHSDEPKGISLFVGSAIDHSVNENLRAKLASGILLPVQQVIDIAIAKFNREIEECENILLKNKEEALGQEVAITAGRDKVIALARLHAEQVAPILNPLPNGIQRPLGIELPNYPFDIGCVIDIQEHDGVIDTKTTAKSPAENAADESDQLTIYAMAVLLNDGYIPQNLRLDFLVANKTPVYRPRTTTRAEEDFDIYLRRVDAGVRAIERGAFVPARESDWWCGRGNCGFWDSCPYVKHSRRPAA